MEILNKVETQRFLQQEKQTIQNFIVRCKIMLKISDSINNRINRTSSAKTHDVLKLESYTQYVDLESPNSEALVFVKKFPEFLLSINKIKEHLILLEGNHNEPAKIAKRTSIVSSELFKIIKFYEYS